MTIIAPEVIKDLLPLYRAGLASPQTRALVEGYLAADPALALEAENAAAAETAREAAELKAYARSRMLLARMRWLFGLAVGLTVLALPVRVHFENGRVADVHLLAMDAPLVFAPLMAVAAACWGIYFYVRRRFAASH